LGFPGLSGLLNDTVNGGSGHDTINVFTSGNLINMGSGVDTVAISGGSDTGGAGNNARPNKANADLTGAAHATFAHGANTHNHTVVGFSQAANDTIHLTGAGNTAADAVQHSKQVNNGQDTRITLHDGSVILLKGVSHIDTSFFS